MPEQDLQQAIPAGVPYDAEGKPLVDERFQQPVPVIDELVADLRGRQDLQQAIETVRGFAVWYEKNAGFLSDLTPTAIEQVLAAAARVPDLEHDRADSMANELELQGKVAELTADVARLREFIGETPDPEIAEAVQVVEAMMGDFGGSTEHERAAVNKLINRASGVTVRRLREQDAADAQVVIDAGRYRALRRFPHIDVDEGEQAAVYIRKDANPDPASKFAVDGDECTLDALADALAAQPAGGQPDGEVTK